MARRSVYLPIEVRSTILGFVTDLDTLHNLVLSSSLYHEAYVSARGSILSLVLRNRYSIPLIGEALLVIRSENLYPRAPTKPERRDKVIALLDQYRRDRQIHELSPTQSDVMNHYFLNFPLSPLEILRVARFLYRTEAFVNEISADLWPRALVDPNKCSNGLELSPMERVRFLRAACRFQTFCTLFGAKELSSKKNYEEGTFSEDFGYDEVHSLFFLLFPPWEFEEIACIHDYLMDKYFDFLLAGNDDIYDGSLSSESEIPRKFVRRRSTESARVRSIEAFGRLTSVSQSMIGENTTDLIH